MSFHWKTALQATKEHSSIEISGFGRFDIREGRARLKLATYERYKAAYEKRIQTLTEGDKDYNRYQLRLETVINEIKFLKERLNEN